MRNEFLTPEFVADGQEAVEGIYPLGALRGRSAGAVVYETTYGKDSRPAAIKISRGDTAEAAETLARWRNSMALAHPNLLQTYAAGASTMHDGPIVYVVMERADESLAGVLAGRRLSESETEEMIAPVLSALEYLHRNGYAHGRIKPTNVLAVGEIVKLSADSAAIADDMARAEDVHAVGRVVEESAGGLSPVLTEIARHALEADMARRWTVRQMQSRLHAPEAVEEAQERRGIPRWGVPIWIFAALAALVLIVAGLAVMRKNAAAPEVLAPVRQPVVTSTAPPNVPQPVSRPGAPAVSIGPGTTGHGRRASGWSVIVAAYGFRAPAEKRLRSMEAKWARFQWHVLEQRADKVYYLVVIGQNLSEDDAETLRRRAVQAGLPRDTYIKRVP